MESVELSLQLTIYTIDISKPYESFPHTFLNWIIFWTRDTWDIAYRHLPVNHSKHGLWHLMNTSIRMINSPFSLSLSNHMLSKWLKNFIISFTKIKTDFEMLSINQLMLYFMKRFTTSCFHYWMTEFNNEHFNLWHLPWSPTELYTRHLQLTTPENTMTYHNALCLLPQNFA